MIDGKERNDIIIIVVTLVVPLSFSGKAHIGRFVWVRPIIQAKSL